MPRKKTSTLSIRLSEYEKQMIVLKARSSSLPLSGYVISALISDDSEKISCLRSVMNEMKSISDKLEHLRPENKGSTDFQDILDAQNELKQQLISLSAKL